MSVIDNASVIDGRGAANRNGGKVSKGGGFMPNNTRAERESILASGNELACDLTEQLTKSTDNRILVSVELSEQLRNGVDYATGRVVSAELQNDLCRVSGVATGLANVAVLSQVERCVSNVGKDKRKAAYSKALRDESAGFGGKTPARQASKVAEVARGAAVFEALNLDICSHGDAASYIAKHLSSWARLDTDTGTFSTGIPERNADFSIVSTHNGKLYRAITPDDCSNIQKAIVFARCGKTRGVNGDVFADQLRALGFVKPKAEKQPGAELTDADIDAAILGTDPQPLSLSALSGMFDRLLNSGNVTAGEALEFLNQASASFRREFAASLANNVPTVADEAIGDVVDDAAALAAQ